MLRKKTPQEKTRENQNKQQGKKNAMPVATRDDRDDARQQYSIMSIRMTLSR